MSRSERRFGSKASRRARKLERRQARKLFDSVKIRKGENKHHKRCRSNGGGFFEGGVCNISIVKKIDHDSWHSMFSNLLPPTICELINQKWLDPRWQFVCVERKET
ncbi:MAG: hypothetical protein WC648_01335 [Candidatus Paceibacterota bacterium]|jgi:hypothetical protein